MYRGKYNFKKVEMNPELRNTFKGVKRKKSETGHPH
jgi:hypothetical protein